VQGLPEPAPYSVALLVHKDDLSVYSLFLHDRGLYHNTESGVNTEK
jgi:hypothetical protein